MQLKEFYNNLAEEGVSERQYFQIDDLSGLMKKSALCQIALSVKSGVSTNTIRHASRRGKISEQTLKAIADSLEVKPSEIAKKENNKGKLADRTILHHHRLISSILSTAVEWGVILDNPATRVKAPSVKDTEPNFLDEVQAQHVIDMLADAPIQYRTMIILLIYSGLRRGEICGLEWTDVDFQNELIHVRRASQYLSNKGTFSKLPKNKKSIRPIKLPSLTFILLKEYRVWQNTERLKRGDQWIGSDRLFTKFDGTPIHPDTPTKWFREFVQSNGLPHVSLHSLRHTNATLQIAGGVNIETVSKRLGHAKTSTTLDIYSHAIRSADAAAAQTVEDLLKPKRKVQSNAAEK